MSEKRHPEGSAPTAPPEENPFSSLSSSPPERHLPPSQPDLLLGSPQPVTDETGQPLFREPPPSYQAAMAYPATSLPYPTNPDGTAFPKPPYSALPSYPIPPVLGQQFPPPPPPPPALTTTPAQVVINPNPPVASRPAAGNCAYCRVGIVSGQTDLCCLICLIVLAVCTFPVGLLFLCFIPCTVHKRCSHCHRIG